MKLFTLRTVCAAAAVSCLVGFSSFDASASPIINYGDFGGDEVMYLDVTETLNTFDPPFNDTDALFGAPTISGNTLNFDPKGFTASSGGGGFPDLTDGQLNMHIMATPGNFLDTLEFAEAGDFSLLGVGTENTYVSVSAVFLVEIREIDGIAIDTLVLAPIEMIFSPSADGDFSLVDYPGLGTPWTGEVEIDLFAVLDAEELEYDTGVTKVSLTLDNTLAAQSEANTSAFIAKKDFRALSITIIPEPSSIALVLLGLALSTVRRRLA